MRRLAAALFLALTVACRRETPQPPPVQPAPRPAATTRQEGGTLVRRLDGDVQTLNYVLQNTENERQVLELIHDSIIDLDLNLAPIPSLAAKWEVLDGGKAYVFHLDPRATFSDGTPVLASDVVFTLNRILDEQSTQFASWFENLDRENTKTVDERTVRVAFSKPRAGQLLAFNIGVLPEHVYAVGDFKKNQKVIGSGPYVVKSRDHSGIVLERRDDYWREKPAIARIRFRTVRDDSVAWKAAQLGEIDVTRVNNDVWARVKDDPAVLQKVRFFDYYQLGYNCIVWNLSDPVLGDQRVRRALAMSFDRQTVIDRLYHGQARAVTGPFTPDQWASNPDVAPVEFNLTAASALLLSAGWRDTDGDGLLDRNGKKFSLTLLIPAGNAPSRDQSQILQETLRTIGVEVEIKALDESAFFDLVLQRNFQAALLSWVNEPDPDPFSLFHSSQIAPAGMNVGGYKSAEADQLMDDARTELDQSRRAYLYHQLHELLAHDQPYLWMLQVSEKWAVNQRVQNVQVAKGVGLFHWYPGSRAWWLRE